MAKRLQIWVPLCAFLVCSAVVLGAAETGRQELPVTLTPDPNTHTLQWADAAGALTSESPWVMRSDLMGPATYLVVKTSAGAGEQCAEELRFQVLAAQRIEYRVVATSDLAGNIRWSIEYGEGKPLRFTTCIPRPSGDRRACLRGGVPRPLMAPLQGAIEARLRGSENFVPVAVAHFAASPPVCTE